MKVWKIAGVTVLFVLAAIYVYQEVQFRKPLTEAEIDMLAMITVGQMNCNWRYDSTRKGEWLRQRSVAQEKLDATLEARWRAALRKYQGLSEDELCAQLDKFPDLVERWHD